ncbi:hypothetical protein [Vulcanimicrobium alpinum]|uniref:hypothetical protein n=1 Tax=Vulcanimicrobium alpinum TaxID=3016050 RepID=UPI00295F0687|nr:hypothetical protein [Vulcanimicrobium alpinum]
MTYAAPCAKNGQYSVSARWNCCGAIVSWSISTLEKSGEKAPTKTRGRIERNDDVAPPRARRAADRRAGGRDDGVAIGPRRLETVHFGARLRARHRAAQRDAVDRRPEPPVERVVRKRRNRRVGHQRRVDERIVLRGRRDVAHEIDLPVLESVAGEFERAVRNPHHGVPAGRGRGRGGAPLGLVACRLAGKRVARPARRDGEEVDALAVSGRVDLEADEVVGAEADLVGRLGGDNRRGLLRLHPDVDRAVIVEERDPRRPGGRGAGGEVGEPAVGERVGPAGVGERRLERERRCGPAQGERAGRKRGGGRGRNQQGKRSERQGNNDQ